MKILDLPLIGEWYNMIESGIKTEEYRKIKQYWIKRLCANSDKLWQCANSNGKITRCVKTITILGAQIYKRTGSYPEEQERTVGFTSTENFLNYAEDD